MAIRVLFYRYDLLFQDPLVHGRQHSPHHVQTMYAMSRANITIDLNHRPAQGHSADEGSASHRDLVLRI